MPIPRAVIDADTLYRRHPRNVLVWHALAGFFELHWSARIVAETRRNLVERNRAAFGEPRAAAVDRTLRRVTDALRLGRAGSLVPDEEIAVREPEMTNDPKDRHVLAAALAAGATAIVTTNLRDFPVRATRPLGVVALTPDDFLTSLLDRGTVEAAAHALRRHARFHGWSISELLALLAASEGSHEPLMPQYVQRFGELTGTKPAAMAP